MMHSADKKWREPYLNEKNILILAICVFLFHQWLCKSLIKNKDIWSHTWMARNAAMHIQFPIRHKTPRWKWSIPYSRKLDINHPAGSGWPLALISFCAVNSASGFPIKAGPRNRTISMAPETHMTVPPTLAWPSILSKFTLSVLHEQVQIWHWTSKIQWNETHISAYLHKTNMSWIRVK